MRRAMLYKAGRPRELSRSGYGALGIVAKGLELALDGQGVTMINLRSRDGVLQ